MKGEEREERKGRKGWTPCFMSLKREAHPFLGREKIQAIYVWRRGENRGACGPHVR